MSSVKCETCKGYNAIEYKGLLLSCETCKGTGNVSGQQEDNTGHQTAKTPDAQPLNNVSGERVTILYKYVERVDGIYYLWKLPNDKEWQEKPTPYTQSPIVQYLHLSRAEYENSYPQPSEQEDNTGHPTVEFPDAQPLDNVSGEPVNRLEVIDHTQTGTGRDFVKWEDYKFEVKLSYQDDGRTLKVFLIDPPEALPSNNASESMRVDAPLTDSKPEKPQGAVGKLYGIEVLPETLEEWRDYALELYEKVQRFEEMAKTRCFGHPWWKNNCDRSGCEFGTQALSSATSSGNTTEPKPSGVMDEQLREILLKTVKLSNDKAWRYDHNDEDTANFFLHDLKALLATEYDRGLKDAAEPNEWRALQDAYDRGYINGVEAEIKCVETSGEHLDLQNKLKAEYDRGKVEELKKLRKWIGATADQTERYYIEVDGYAIDRLKEIEKGSKDE